VKKLSLDKEPQQVTVHFDGRKKQSLDDIHPSLIQEVKEEVVEEDEVLKHKRKTPDVGVEDRNEKVKRVHEAAVQKLQGKIGNLENSMKSLTAQKDTAVLNETKANSNNSKLKLKIEELTLKLKTVEEDAKRESKDSVAENNLAKMTKELETTKTRLLEAQEQVSVYHNIAQSSEQEVEKHKSKVRELLLKLGTAQRDANKSIGTQKGLQDKVAVLTNELKSVRSERNKTMNELTAQIDLLTSELAKSKKLSTKLTYEATIAKKRKIGNELKDIQVRVKISNGQVGGELTAAVPRPIELNQDRTTTEKVSAQTEKPPHLNNFESSHTLAANLPFEPPALPPLPGMTNHEPTTTANTREAQPLQVQLTNTEDLAVAVAEQYVDSIVADETPTAGRSDALRMSQSSEWRSRNESQISELANLLRTMPPSVRKAAENNPDLVAQLMVENKKKQQGAQLNQPFGLNTLAEASNLHSSNYYDAGQQHQYMNMNMKQQTQHQWPINNLQGYPYYAAAQFQQIQQPYYPLGQPTSPYVIPAFNQFESACDMHANNLRQNEMVNNNRMQVINNDKVNEEGPSPKMNLPNVCHRHKTREQAEEKARLQAEKKAEKARKVAQATTYKPKVNPKNLPTININENAELIVGTRCERVDDQPQHKKLSPSATTVNENAKHGLWPKGTGGMMQQNDTLQANEVQVDESWPQPPQSQVQKGGVNESSSYSINSSDDTPPAQIDITNEDINEDTTPKKLTIMMRMSPSRPRRFLNAKKDTVDSQLAAKDDSQATVDKNQTILTTQTNYIE